MLAKSTTGASNRAPVDLASLGSDWAFDVKLDGLRAIAYIGPDDVRILNRSMAPIHTLFPEVVASLRGLPQIVLDGEVVAEDGRFETVATRGKTVAVGRIAMRATSMPCRFVPFDVLRVGDTDVMHLTWTERRSLLEKLEGVLPVVPASTNGPALYAQVAGQGMEGVIAKRRSSRYLPGKRSDAWLKFKAVRRITAVAVGYDPGEGSRAAFGAMHLALIGPNGPVRIGTVGSGFKGSDLTECKDLLDAGTPFLVEVEALNRTSGGVLRFPVFRGIRRDLPITAATLDQLDALPLS